MAGSLPPPEFAPVDPYVLTRREAASTQIARFYKHVTVVEEPGRFEVLLDGRPVKTPARTDVTLPSRGVARLLADEWQRQGDVLRPETMPVTRLVNTVLDGVAKTMAEVQAEIVKFAGTDLLFYRADSPTELVEFQAREWDPVVAWARDALQARFYLAEGVIYVAQPETALAAVAQAVSATVGQGDAAPFRLGALHVMTTLSGSALLALAVGQGVFTAEEAWRKAHVDEDFQIGRWGADADAADRRDRRWADMQAASQVLAAVG